ncbi:hypothetical protein IGI04_000656, partial [Brassica rapa subsp. trilocularis]
LNPAACCLSLSRLRSKKMSQHCHADCQRAMDAQEEHDAAERAAMMAVSLISSARMVANLDREYTSYSVQFLVDNAGRKNESAQDPQPSTFTIQDCLQYLVEIATPKPESEPREVDERRNTLTLKDCLEYALKEGLPKLEDWTHVGCVHKPPPFASLIPRVPMKGELIEAKTSEEASKLLRNQPVGAKLHVFNPEFERVRDEGFYEGPSGPESRYVGLRDVMITGNGRMKGGPFLEFNGQYHTLIGMIYEVLDREKRRTVGTALKQLEQRGFNQLSLTGAMETIHLIQIFFSQFCWCVISSLGSLIWCVISRSEALEYQEASHLSCVPHQSTNLDTDRVFDSLSKEKTISITFHPPTPPSSDPGRDSHSRAAPSDQPAYWSELPLKPAERRSVVPVLSLKQEEEKQQASILASPIQQIEESHKTEPEPTTLCLKLEEEAEVAEAECGHVPDQIKQEEKVPGGSSKALELVLPTVEQGDNFKSLACELLIRPLVCLQLSLVEHLRVVKGLQQVVFEPGGSLCVNKLRRDKQELVVVKEKPELEDEYGDQTTRPPDQKDVKLRVHGLMLMTRTWIGSSWREAFNCKLNKVEKSSALEATCSEESSKMLLRQEEGLQSFVFHPGRDSHSRAAPRMNKLRRDKQELVVVKEKPELEDEYGDHTTRPPDQKDVKLRVHGLMFMTRTWIGSSWREAFNCKLNKVEKSSALEATCSEESSKMLLRHEEGLQSFVFHPGETREYHTLIGMIYEVLDREKRRTVGTALKQLEQRGFNQLSLTGAMETIHLIQICMENKENMSGSFWIGLYLDLGEIGLFRSKKRVAARILIHLLSSWPNRTWRI